jgi:hypothetical protein
MRILSNLLAIAMLFVSCGKTEKVEGIKGPRGDKGERGEDGRDDPTIIYTPHATPVPVPQPYPNPYPYPYPSPVVTVTTTLIPPVIIINRPWPDCNSGNDSRCRSGDTVVCACIDTYWQTIGVNVHYRDRLRIKNEGPCFTTALQPNDFWADCWGRPQPVPQPNNNRC